MAAPSSDAVHVMPSAIVFIYGALAHFRDVKSRQGKVEFSRLVINANHIYNALKIEVFITT
jgi:hypothetical protein